LNPTVRDGIENIRQKIFFSAHPEPKSEQGLSLFAIPDTLAMAQAPPNGIRDR
jgi:hypothetical protein